MATQPQEQQPAKLQTQGKRSKRLSQRTLVIVTVILIVLAVAIIWILSSLSIIPRSWAAISSIIVTVFGAVFTFLQSLHLFFPPDTHKPPVASEHGLPPPYISVTSSPSPQIPPTIVQLPTTQPLTSQSLPTVKAMHRGIGGLPSPTDPRTIQQREHVVKEVYTKLMQPGITAIALTGIGGVGKSTLAALIYRYTEEQRSAQNGPFLAEALWLAVDPAVTFADLASNLFEALGKPMPDLSNLAPQNQAVVLFNALNATEKPRLVILDQFENLLDWETGHALTDRPGVGEWLDIINGQKCTTRILLTSRPRPVGTREFPPTYMQEYPVRGLEVAEGVELLQNQGVKGTEEELQAAVTRCAGHAFSLTLLASLIREHSMSLTTLFKDSTLWTGDIATNLLDQIYTQRLSEVQRELLLAFAVYREPVPLDAAIAIITKAPKSQVASALKALRTQHLLEAVGEGRYQLHAIIADYAQSHFDESNEQANEEALRTAHARAAQYYLQQAATTCPPREQRRGISDIHDLIEAVWQQCQAEKWQEAYDLMEQEEIFADLRRWGSNAILLEVCQLLLPVEKWFPKPLQAARLYNYLGRVYRTLGQLEQSHKHIEQSLRVGREAGERREEGLALYYLGRNYFEQGHKKEALEYFEQALHILREVGDHIGEGKIVTVLGRLYNDLGRREQARESIEQALDIFREVGDREDEITALNSLGSVYSDLGQTEQSLNYYEQALDICREIGDHGAEGWTLNNLGKVYAHIGQKKQALECLKQSLSIRREMEHRLGVGRTLKNLGGFYCSYGENEKALKCLEEALNISREVGDRPGEGMALNYLGVLYHTLRQQERAREFLKRALNISRELGDRWGEGETLHEIGKLYFGQYSYDSALACFLLAQNLLTEVKSPDRDGTQSSIEALHRLVGDEQFTTILAKVEPQAQQIVDQALREGME